MIFINNIKKIFILLLCTSLMFVSCGCNKNKDWTTSQMVFNLQGLHSGDAKFLKNSVVTSVDGKLTIYSMDGKKIKTYDDIHSNWIDSISDEGIIVYGNFNNEIGIAILDSDYNMISNEIVMKTPNLQIDPAIMKVKNNYYMTITEISGTVNNADKEMENGLYTIHLYKSDDLKTWTLLSDVVSCKNNIEDVDFFYHNNKFYVVYEKEEVDKGNSAICSIISKDSDGIEWEREKQLLKADCDHEPAAIFYDKNGYVLYYSSDKDSIGQSYMGGKIYYAEYNNEFEVLCQDIELKTDIDGGILLYDVKIEKNTALFLVAENYLTDSNLAVVEISGIQERKNSKE